MELQRTLQKAVLALCLLAALAAMAIVVLCAVQLIKPPRPRPAPCQLNAVQWIQPDALPCPQGDVEYDEYERHGEELRLVTQTCRAMD